MITSVIIHGIVSHRCVVSQISMSHALIEIMVKTMAKIEVKYRVFITSEDISFNLQQSGDSLNYFNNKIKYI